MVNMHYIQLMTGEEKSDIIRRLLDKEAERLRSSIYC